MGLYRYDIVAAWSYSQVERADGGGGDGEIFYVCKWLVGLMVVGFVVDDAVGLLLYLPDNWVCSCQENRDVLTNKTSVQILEGWDSEIGSGLAG